MRDLYELNGAKNIKGIVLSFFSYIYIFRNDFILIQ
jgi:hypothetical protein